VVLPASKKDYAPTDICEKEVQLIRSDNNDFLLHQSSQAIRETSIAGLSQKPVVLLVEDNVELVDFIKDILEPAYEVVLAYNGEEALRKLEKIMPELIISDVMMPGMDGYELSHRLKNDIKTSHIPIMLLTAKSGYDNHLKGLNSGADLYIEKPFMPELLIKNIENIVLTRKCLIERFKNDAYIDMNELAVSESDKEFIEKITRIVKDHISTDFDVSFLIKEMGQLLNNRIYPSGTFQRGH
jgi:DNA-binding response OmpR family regulator